GLNNSPLATSTTEKDDLNSSLSLRPYHHHPQHHAYYQAQPPPYGKYYQKKKF
ncbi:unnamed protein product, partial [Rotaria sp. Silwood1]